MSEETIYKAEEKAKMAAQSSLLPWLLIGGGVLILLSGALGLELMDYLWPGFVIIPGLVLMYPAWKSTAVEQSKLSFLAVPGAVLLAGGVLLASMNLVNYFEAWAYAWPLLPAAVAAGVLYITRYDDNPRLVARAHRFIRAMVFLALGLAFFFEVLVFGHANPVLGVILLLAGLLTLRRRRLAAA